jgi:hypothetical protein
LDVFLEAALVPMSPEVAPVMDSVVAVLFVDWTVDDLSFFCVFLFKINFSG